MIVVIENVETQGLDEEVWKEGRRLGVFGKFARSSESEGGWVVSLLGLYNIFYSKQILFPHLRYLKHPSLHFLPLS